MSLNLHLNRYYLLWLILSLILLGCVRFELTPTPLPPTPTVIPTATPLVTFINKPMPLVYPAIPQPLPTFTPTATPEPLCFWPDLPLTHHISASGSYTETQWTASGLMACRIEPDSCAYHHLVGIMDPTIIVKGEEEPPYNTEDVLIHPAMIQPLSRLNRLVLAEWGGVYRLRLTDAYDSLLEHDLNQEDESRKYSLHFEGRAIDFTTWPVNRGLYGRLCALAHCAGFDWVHNEGTHCHASINAVSLCEKCPE